MTSSSGTASFTYLRKRKIGLLLVLLGYLFALGHLQHIRGTLDRDFGQDYRAVYGSTRCILAGCNPYSSAETKAQFLAGGGSLADAERPGKGPFQPYFMGYPPPTLLFLTPFALLSWPLALNVFLGVSIALYAVALILFAYFCSEYVPLAANICLAIFVATQVKIVMLGQPTLLAAALLCIGIWCLLKERHTYLGLPSFALSLMMKPQLGGLFLLYFLLANSVHRKRAFQVIGLTILFCIPALALFALRPSTHNWTQDYRQNLTHITDRGNISDPGPTRDYEHDIICLQVLVSIYRDDPAFYNHVVWAFSAVVLAGWMYKVIKRRPGPEKDILCLAAIGAFSMLPIYHRLYDTRALLILFPAIALLMQRTKWWGRAAAVVTLWTVFVISDWYSVRSSISGHVIQSLIKRHMVVLQAATFHAAPLALLSVAIFYLVVLFYGLPKLGLTYDSQSAQTR